ncbi:MAG: MFS transporter [Pseudomonadota bacterium]
MVRTSALFISRATLPALAAMGLMWGSFAAMLPQIKTTIGVSDAELGAILFLAAVGSVIAMAAAPWLGRAAPRLAMPGAGLAVAVTLAALGLAGSPWALGAAIIAIGFASGLLDILANARVAVLEATHARGLMNLNHAGYSLSYAATAAATGLARDAGWPPALWFALVGAGIVVLTAGMARNDDAPGQSNQPTVGGAKPRLATVVWIAGFIALIAFFAENATEGWSALHIERTLGQGAVAGALGPAMLGLTMGIGRLAGHVTAPRGSEAAMMAVGSLVSAAGLALAASAPGVATAFMGFALFGLGASVIAPSAFALAGRAVDDESRARAISAAAIVSYVGFFIGPPAMGFMSEAVGLRAAFATASAVLVLIPLLVLLPQVRRV